MGHREYDPANGRFLTRDPIGYRGGINLYGYTANNPVNWMDPMGLNPLGDWYMGGMGAFSEWLDGSFLFGGATAAFGTAAGQYDSGCASGWDVAGAGLNWGVHAGASAVVIVSAGAGLAAISEGGLVEAGEGSLASELPDETVIVRGGTTDIPPPGTVYSGAQGGFIEEAGAGVPHNTIRSTTVGGIRQGGGDVVPEPEPAWPGGPMNPQHVNITEGPGGSGWTEPFPNPEPTILKGGNRIPSRPKM